MTTINEATVVKFLLGRLAEDIRAELEERIFTDDAFYHQVLAIQEELSDDYVQGRLLGKQRAQFEKHFLRSARRKARVEFAAALNGALRRAAISRVEGEAPAGWFSRRLAVLGSALPLKPGLVALASALGVLLMASGSWSVIQTLRSSRSLEQVRRERASLAEQSNAREMEAARDRSKLESEIAALQADKTAMQAQIEEKQQELERLHQAASSNAASKYVGAAMATFVLPAGLSRSSDEPEKLVIPDGVRVIQLKLSLEKEEHYRNYLAEIRTARGNIVATIDGLTANKASYGQVVPLRISRKVLPVGEYEIALKGVAGPGNFKAVGYYYLIALTRQ
jgi:hypothetical protein